MKRLILAVFLLCLMASAAMAASPVTVTTATSPATTVYAGGYFAHLWIENLTSSTGTIYCDKVNTVTTSSYAFDVTTGSAKMMDVGFEPVFCTIVTGTATVPVYIRN